MDLREKIFLTEEGDVTWRFAEKEDLALYPKKFKKAVFIEFVQAEEVGKGQGSILMKKFIAKMKAEKIDVVYLWASYSSANYDEEQDPTVGHQRLVKFYENLGFETAGSPEFGEDFTVDMYLELSKIKESIPA